VSFNIKVRLVTNGGQLIDGQTDIDLYDAMALRAGQVMMMAVTADAVVVRAISKLDAVQQAHIDQHLYRAVHGCPAQARLYLAQLLPEIVNREIGSARSKLCESLRNQPAWACVALAHLIECCMYLVRYHVWLSFCCRAVVSSCFTALFDTL
jgi:hypothetical protein